MFPAVTALVAVAAFSWWYYPREQASDGVESLALAARPPEATADAAPIPPPADPPEAQEPEKDAPAPPSKTGESRLDANPVVPIETPVPEAAPTRGASLIESGRQALGRKDLLAARTELNAALAAGLDTTSSELARSELTKIGTETVFSGRILPGDEMVDRYVIKAGDSLARIAHQYLVTADLLAALNGIADKNRIREGQTIKVLRGPFHAVVHKRDYRLDVYLGDVFVRSFPVGLGMDNSTPTGEWRVKSKLVNPTYYPPRGGAIIAADDPANPLGERWIGLEGVFGEALAQERYGIHGTNEPESIGRSVSLGCVRLHNADVEQLYMYLVEGRSSVIVLE